MKTKLLITCLAILLLLQIGNAQADEVLGALTPNQEIASFRTEYLYDNDADVTIGARFRHTKSGMILDVLRIQSLPQAYMWFNTPPTSDKGEPHACEHLLLGKGNKGRYVASLEDMSLGSSSASTYRLFTNYHFHTTAGGDVFYDLFEAKLDALLNPNFTDEEIRREVCNMGVVIDPSDSSLSLDEKGTVYTEMVSSFERSGSRLWHEMELLMYGKNHPISNVSGGTPEALRELTPEDMWEFHKEAYRLCNTAIIVSIPDEYEINSFLETVSGILDRLSPDAVPGDDLATLDDRLPAPNPAPSGEIKYVEYPYQNENEPGYLEFAWPPTLDLSFNEVALFDLFMNILASGQTSNLYKKFVDSQTRLMDIGTSGSWAGRAYDFGNPAYIGFSNVRRDAMNEATIDSVLSIIIDEIRLIANYEDGSEELKAFNQRALNRITSDRRRTRTFLSRPPRFGYRGTGASWRWHLKDLQRAEGFNRDLMSNDRFDFMEELLSSDKNVWREYLPKWQFLDVEPYVLATVANPNLTSQALEEKQVRIDEFTEVLKEKHGTDDERAAIEAYQAEYDARTEELDQIAGNIEMPDFVDNPPMTYDDQLDYRVDQLPGGGPLVVSTFETVTGATAGMAFDMRVIPESQLVYVAAFPTLLDDVGVIKDGVPIAFDEMREKIRQDILWAYASISTNPTTGRVELLLEGSGSNELESTKALEWLELKLFHPDWRVENLPRIRDAVDLSLSNMRNEMKGSEESWVNDPASAYYRQSDHLLLMADCFLTRAHAMQRIRWMLKDAPNESVADEFSQFMSDLAESASLLDRSGVQSLLSSLSSKLGASEGSEEPGGTVAELEDLSDEAKQLVSDAVDDLRHNLNEIPDATLAEDWRYLCMQISSDFAVQPNQVLASLDQIMNLIRAQDNVRSYVIASGSVQETVLPAVHDMVSKLSDQPSEKQQYSETPVVQSRLAEHATDQAKPVYVGLVNENTQNGVFVNQANCPGLWDYDTESLLDFVASKMYSGGGPHSMFMKTWGAGLAYSNGLGSGEVSERIRYYAERCPDLAQTMQFVVDELKTAEADPTLADYAIAQIFGSSRAGSRYESRGAAMAADLADGVTPEKVRQFREAVLKLREMPDLHEHLRERFLSIYGRVLPGLDPPGSEVEDALYFIIGPEKQFKSFEEYLHRIESGVTVHRLYPRDFWIKEQMVY